MQPRDAARLAVPADVAHVEDLVGGDFFPCDGVACGRSELVEAHAVVCQVVRVAKAGRAADGFAADEADARGIFFCLEKLREEVAVDGDLAEDERLRGVEVDLCAGIECPCFRAVSVLKILVDIFVPGGVRSLRLHDNSGADGSLCQMLDDIRCLRCVVVEPAGEAQNFKSRMCCEFALGICRGEPDEAAIERRLSGFKGGGFCVQLARATSSGAGSTPT